MEHSTGITEEPIPDLTTMTLGSELSITEAFNKTELSDSGDSLKSFEKHEMSTTDSLTDESWAGKHSGKLFFHIQWDLSGLNPDGSLTLLD